MKITKKQILAQQKPVIDKQDLDKIIDYHSDERSIVEALNVSKTFGFGSKQKKVLDNLNFSIFENDRIAIVGANGSGKTTLLEMLSTISKVSSGKILYKFDYKKTPLEKIGIQFQAFEFPIGFTVKDLIEFIYNIKKVKITQEHLQEMIIILGLESELNKIARKLSGGQQQRLNLLLALMGKPSILFLDELTNGLDLPTQKIIVEYFLKLVNIDKITIVMVSHNSDEIEAIANRIILLDNKNIVVDTTVENIKKKFKTIDNFFEKYVR